MSRFLVPLILYSVVRAIAIVPQGVDDALIEDSRRTTARCAHQADTDNAVIAWPGESWYVIASIVFAWS